MPVPLPAYIQGAYYPQQDFEDNSETEDYNPAPFTIIPELNLVEFAYPVWLADAGYVEPELYLTTSYYLARWDGSGLESYAPRRQLNHPPAGTADWKIPHPELWLTKVARYTNDDKVLASVDTNHQDIDVIAVFFIISLIGISLFGLTENILTLLKILPLVIITLVLLPFIQLENLAPTVPLTVMGLFSKVIIVYWPFTGFEISALPVDEMRDPRLVARSLGIVMFTVAAIYLLLNLALIGSVGSEVLAASPAPIATAVSLVFSGSGYLVAVIGIFAMLSAMNAYIIASSRVVHNLAMEHDAGAGGRNR